MGRPEESLIHILFTAGCKISAYLTDTPAGLLTYPDF
jgi:hypothetical protein